LYHLLNQQVYTSETLHKRLYTTKKKSEASDPSEPRLIDTLYIALAHLFSLPTPITSGSYSTTAKVLLNPYWVTGFTDAEGSFSCIVSKRPSGGWKISLSFEINLHIKDIAILHQIQAFFNCGIVSSRPNRNLAVYRATRLSDLVGIIIPHFITYPLVSQKQLDFELWHYIATQMSIGVHLTATGFEYLLTYYAAINLGVST
jgi:hypothetical protein